MSFTTDPNMNFPIPTVGSEPGPQFAFDINSALTIIGAHNHTNGLGVQIPPAGLNINANLPFGNNFATNVAGVTLTGQSSTPANNTVYNSNNSSGDLYYVNNSGLAIQITNASGIVGSPGTISGISGTASASYSTPTFIWRSATSVAANMDFGSAIMRNVSPNSTYALTLSPPAALAANYTLVLPPNTATPSFLSVDGSGNIINYAAVAGGLVGSNLANGTITATQIAALTITASQIANSTITNTQIANSTITNTQIANSTITGAKLVNGISMPSGTILPGNVTIASSYSPVLSQTASTILLAGTVDTNTGAVTGQVGSWSISFHSPGYFDINFATSFAAVPAVTFSQSPYNQTGALMNFYGVVNNPNTGSVSFYNGGGGSTGLMQFMVVGH